MDGMGQTISADEKQWQAECDARTLAEAEEIKGDPERLKAAQACADKEADDKLQEAANMKKVAGMRYTQMG
jgi:hypothetical protein